jgi:hypothetical protein
LKGQHQLSPRTVTHTPHKDCQLSSKDGSITQTSSPKPKTKKQVIGLSTSVKHNNFGIIYHTTELGFLLSFIHIKYWTLFLGHTWKLQKKWQSSPGRFNQI